jgi:hypothetical protein
MAAALWLQFACLWKSLAVIMRWHKRATPQSFAFLTNFATEANALCQRLHAAV